VWRLVVAGLLFVLAGCDLGSVSGLNLPRTVAAPAILVEIAEATVGGVSGSLVTNATVESERQADVVPQATGLVREVRVSDGDPVQAGQVLAIIDNISLDEAANRAVAEVRRLEAELEVSKRLVEQRAMAQRELDELEGRLLAAQSTLREARVTSKQTRLVAPFEGVVGIRDLRVGELASSTSRAFQIVDLDALVIFANLPERDVARVRRGQRARAVSAYDPDLFAQATVERIAPVIDATSGTFRVQLRLDPGQRALRPGQFVSVSIEVERHEDVVVVPKRAIVYEDGDPVLYRMVEKAPTAEELAEPAPVARKSKVDVPAPDPEPLSPFVAERVRIQLGLVDDGFAEIVEGVAPGDRIVVLGQSALKDGSRVKPMVPEDGL
jgi:membrane fusion protein (multidrug efflux system)